MQYILDNLFSFIFLLVLLPAYIGIKNAITSSIEKIPDRIHEKQMEEIKHNNEINTVGISHQNSRELQIDNFFRDIGSSEMEKILEEWVSLIVDPTSTKSIDNDKYNKMTLKVLMYGSPRTVKTFAAYSQYIYSKSKSNNVDVGKKENPYIILLFISLLVSNLKEDFSGYLIDPKDAVYIKVNDIFSEATKDNISEAELVIKEYIKLVS
ncbi:hypothetical protein CKN86_09540 [Carnobacterium divergens]|uniref:hypothetical protein n=1 Tax=Carnobacterium divergens TaxID=2748 RepID=UPI000D3FD571|nr:hypothetical protein [Carnobacterium divergens]MCO6019348.1 hypothetical protein [Carnobacterium divergens]TFI60668.1 hypothetical protein CKN62_09680 [Carnobacterium divergens]TFI87691.1 hypothetical protein CKN84_09570 [Carnobacterium divergens]TFJ02258.1 hypothetical protein CKN86_09540 [Carnobacterium divergens]TFJ03769.1 hypothetical protein CKN65_09580 [Carnobacterium divergens]